MLSDEQAQEIVRLLSPKAEDSPKSAQPVEQNHLTNGTNNSGLVDSMISMNDSYQSMLSYDSGPTINDSYASLVNESGLQSDRLADTLADSMEVSTGSLQGVGEPETDQSSYLCPPQPIKIIGEQDGVHFFEDGHFWTEVCSLISYLCVYINFVYLWILLCRYRAYHQNVKTQTMMMNITHLCL